MTFVYRLLIGLYQKHLSPRKGYRCAYSLENGGTGCSGAVLRILEENGLWKGWSLIQQRFEECGDAAEKRKKRQRDEKKKGSDCLPQSACDGITCIDDCGPAFKKCDLPDVPSCDCGGLSLRLSRKDDCQSCKNCGFANLFSRWK